ncbi:MAG: acetylglutamate kinase [Culturomica sp.]|jgi:acetylglutamate kinase|nr:acetylglutamate kinase [Culturomica sp.]
MQVKIIKIGGKLVEDDAVLNALTERLTAFHPGCVLVHGGGSMAGRLSTALGLEIRMHQGRRITDSSTLEVAVMVYAGLANKKIVAGLQARGADACGLSGCDMGLVVSHKREAGEIDWGFVGDVDTVRTEALALLLENRILPVISPITCSKEGQLLNTNADSVAGAVAIALSSLYETELTFCFDKPGVLLDVNDEQSIIPRIDKHDYRELLARGVLHSGMLPKLENAFKTLEAGVGSVRLTNPENLNGGTVLSL